MSSSLEALVLDFGGVVIKTPFEVLQPFERRAGIPAGSLAWFGPFAPDRDEQWRAMQRNEISERDYWALRAAEAGRAAGQAKPWTTRDLIAGLFAGPQEEFVRPEAVAAIVTARGAGIPVAVLTNDLAAFHGRAWYDALDVARLIAPLVDASLTGVLKPAAGAYAQVLEELNVAPHAALFVDDQPRNVEGARAFGMETLWFEVARPRASFEAALARFGLSLETEIAR